MVLVIIQASILQSPVQEASSPAPLPEGIGAKAFGTFGF